MLHSKEYFQPEIGRKIRIFSHVIFRDDMYFQNGRHFIILLFACKLALVALFKENILLNFKFKNETTRDDLKENKRTP